MCCCIININVIVFKLCFIQEQLAKLGKHSRNISEADQETRTPAVPRADGEKSLRYDSLTLHSFIKIYLTLLRSGSTR